jgi:hypothetical protein
MKTPVAMRRCARCDKTLPRDPQRRVYSTYTHNYYCIEIDACNRRVRRLERAARIEATT